MAMRPSEPAWPPPHWAWQEDWESNWQNWNEPSSGNVAADDAQMQAATQGPHQITYVNLISSRMIKEKWE